MSFTQKVFSNLLVDDKQKFVNAIFNSKHEVGEFPKVLLRVIEKRWFIILIKKISS